MGGANADGACPDDDCAVGTTPSGWQFFGPPTVRVRFRPACIRFCFPCGFIGWRPMLVLGFALADDFLRLSLDWHSSRGGA
jgi:hypothetical protein